MEWVKTTAKTLPEAIDLALDNLGVDESEAEIVVLEEPRQGLFGRMRGTARVEARVKPKAIRPKTERNRNRRSRSEGGSKGGNDRGKNRSSNRNAGKGGQGGSRNSDNRNSDNRDGGQRNSKSNDRGGKPRQGDNNSDAKAGQGQGQKSRDRSRDGGSGGGREQGGRNGGQRSKARSNANDHDTKPKEETPVEEVSAHLQTFLSDLTEAFGFDSAVTVDNTEADVLVGKIEGQHGLLVGPKGRTLDAVQELARISCQRTVPSSVRIKVDVGGYREKRVEALQAFARQAADSAADGGVEVALEPMSPADRKAIHDAISDDNRVETRSVGTEPRRKVIVVPVMIEDEAEESEQSSDEIADEEE
ncbi:MAG: RNA-binding cell elongation regulator Jag/EloR [Acidimicrobiales bacterium]